MRTYYDQPAADVVRAFEAAARSSPPAEPDAPDRYVTSLRYLRGVLLARFAEVKPPARTTLTAAPAAVSTLYDATPLEVGRTYTVRRWVYEPTSPDPHAGWMVELREMPGLYALTSFERN